MEDVRRNVPGRGPSKAKTRAWAKARALCTDQWWGRLQLGELWGWGGGREMPSEGQVEAGSGRDCKGFGFYSKCDGGGAGIKQADGLGGCSTQEGGRWGDWEASLGHREVPWSGREDQSRDTEVLGSRGLPSQQSPQQ